MTAPVLIRPLHLRDMDRILEIEEASFGEEAYDRNLFAEFLHKCGGLFLVAAGGRHICGYMVTCIGGRGQPGRAELVSVAVDPAFRGKGVASSLMTNTLRRLRLRRVERLTLVVRDGNAPARAFYDDFGFRKLRRVPRYYEDGEDGILMRKML
jgi:ribosomal-protein-alanine N-acetyltransferase